MSIPVEELFKWVKHVGDEELANGDYVTLSRVIRGYMVEEVLVTFSDITIKRRRPLHACYAETECEEQTDCE